MWVRTRTYLTTIRAATVSAVLAGAVALAPAPAQAAPTPTPTPTPAVTCTYYLTEWQGGFVADIRLVNRGPAINGWVVRWTFAHPTTITAVWGSQITQTASVANAVNTTWNSTLGTNKALSFGWSASAAATEVPTDLTLNGVPC